MIRFFIQIVFVVICVAKIMFYNVIQEFGFISAILLFFVAGFMVASIGCAFLSLHLVYHLMSHYIKLSRYQLADNEDGPRDIFELLENEFYPKSSAFQIR